MSEFSRKQLEKYGWSDGKGLGKEEDGIVEPVKSKLKLNSHGIGYDSGEQFKFHWWEHVFNRAASNLTVDNKEENVTFKSKEKDGVVIQTKRPNKFVKNDLHLGRFVKTQVLTEEGLKTCQIRNTIDECENGVSKSRRLTEDELFIKSGGLTCHKAARHGHRMSGKLSRVQMQDQEFLLDNKKNLDEDEKERDTLSSLPTLLEIDSVKVSDATKKKSRKRKHKQMHAGVEEIELEPCDFFIDIATLIIEGRVPGLTDKGFSEGPHCRPLYGQNRHICDSASPDCQQYENLEKHLLVLWKNALPMSVEVLLYPECCQPVGRNIQVETSSIPDAASCTLLEQWTLHMSYRRNVDSSIVPRGLLQAVRSFLHFSQLSAWLSIGKGKMKTNIHYRICVPGEVFATKFEQSPDTHTFPVSKVGKGHAMKITVKSLPRQGEFPKVPCVEHGVGLDKNLAVNFVSTDKGIKPDASRKALIEPRESQARRGGLGLTGGTSKDKFQNDSRLEDLSFKYPEINAKCNSYGVKNPVSETSLGDCLLDPPQSLLMYPKRYQSPSRCGSPSLEVPEHLMFGTGASSSKSEALSSSRLHSTPMVLTCHSGNMTRDRSRPQRRPVVERFLKKQYGVSTPSNSVNRDCDRLTNFDQTKKLHLDQIRNSGGGIEDGLVMNCTPHYTGKYPPKELLPDRQLPSGEMRLVLDSLRQRLPARKSEYDKSQRNTDNLFSENYLLKSLKCKTLSSEPKCNKKEVWRLNKDSPDCKMVKEPFKKCEEPLSSISKDNQWFRDHLLFGSQRDKTTLSSIEDSVSSYEESISSVSSSLDSSILSSSPPYQNYSIASIQNVDSLNDEESRDAISDVTKQIPSLEEKPEEIVEMRDLMIMLDKNCNASVKMEDETIEDTVVPTSGDLPEEYKLDTEESRENDDDSDSVRDMLLNNSQSINASKRMLGRNFAFLYYKMLKSTLNLPMQDDSRSESPDKNGHVIPSAAEKLKFRRSLDSATCMVFHQNTGLPLTSSPAPIRKSGTCFDFDSSLTSVAAIKKALFEKDPELDEETRRLISTSAPASTTTSNLLGNFEESVLNGRLEPVSTVEGFTAEIGASGSFCPRHKTLPVTVFFYTLHDIHKVTSPYLGHINLGRKGYNIPKKGTVQVTLFNPHRTVVKMFVVRYDLSDMPPCSQTFVRQRTLYMPTGASEDDEESRKWLRYLIHLRFASSKSGKIYLHTDIRMIVFRKSDLDAATIHGQRPYELRSFTQGPKNPKFSPCK